MENLQKLFQYVKALPVWGRVLSIVIMILIAVIMFFTSCSSTRAVVRNPRNSAATSITISVSNPQAVEISPSADSSKLNIQLLP